MTITEQEIFDQSTLGLIAQGGPSKAKDSPRCLYRGPGGRKCAVGILITDEEYKPEMDGDASSVQCLVDNGLLPERLKPHVHLLCVLQDAHDNTLTNSWADWKADLNEIALDFGLSTAVLDQCPSS
jgi:hypothetical protein